MRDFAAVTARLSAIRNGTNGPRSLRCLRRADDSSRNIGIHLKAAGASHSACILTWGEPTAAVLTLMLIGVGTFGKFKGKMADSSLQGRKPQASQVSKIDGLAACGVRRLTWRCSRKNCRTKCVSWKRKITKRRRSGRRTGVHPCMCGPPCTDTCDDALHELIEYYRPKRLHVQMRYLARKSKSDEESGSWTATVVQIIFFASFAFVLAHVAVHLATAAADKGTGPTLLEHVLIALAAGVPVIAAGFRTYRASREFERNALRHRATLYSLETPEDQLPETKHLADKFRLLGFCELVLEADCRDFMRLLCEVEWYG